MAQLEKTLSGNFGHILVTIENCVLNGSASASLEAATDWREGDVRCAVRVFERYSMLGKNRLSLSVTLLGIGDTIRLSAITAGGSSAVFFKVNTLGEEAFLDCIEDVLRHL